MLSFMDLSLMEEFFYSYVNTLPQHLEHLANVEDYTVDFLVKFTRRALEVSSKVLSCSFLVDCGWWIEWFLVSPVEQKMVPACVVLVASCRVEIARKSGLHWTCCGICWATRVAVI